MYNSENFDDKRYSVLPRDTETLMELYLSKTLLRLTDFNT